MPVPNNWEGLRTEFARLALRKGYNVPQRFGGTAEELYCFPAIGQTIKEMGPDDFRDILSTIWGDDAKGRRQVLAAADAYFARRDTGKVLTQKEAKAEWKAARGTEKENPEAAVVWGLAAMLQEAP